MRLKHQVQVMLLVSLPIKKCAGVRTNKSRGSVDKVVNGRKLRQASACTKSV